MKKMKFKQEESCELWQEILKIDMVSSEEVGEESDEEVLIVRSLPW